MRTLPTGMNRRVSLTVLSLIFAAVCIPNATSAASYDISIDKSTELSAANVWDVVPYTLTISNSGPDAATNMTVTDDLDLHVTYQNDLWGTCTFSSSSFIYPTLTVNWLNLAAGGTCTLTYSVELDSWPDLSDWVIVPGRVTVEGMNWQQVSFGRTYNTVPLIFATVTTNNNGNNTPVPAVRNVTVNWFEIAVCVDAGSINCSSNPAAESVDYFVVNMDLVDNYSWIDAGTTTLDTDGSNTRVNFNKTFSPKPSVWATPQTYSQNGKIAATIWADDGRITSTRTDLVWCVHQGVGDSCTNNQPTETTAWLAIQGWSAVLSTFEAGIQSTSNASWSAISYENKVTPYVMSMVNDDNGNQDPKYPWVRNVSSASAQVRFCEQDGANDCDNHRANNSAWFVIDGYMHYINNVATITAVDDTNSTNNYSYVDLAIGTCWNGIIEGLELCDDANTNNNDSCPNNCGLAVCGDGVPEGDEECDDGDVDNNDACKNDCSYNYCGDGYAYIWVEACDDGNASAYDACDTSGTALNSSGVCSLTFCWDWVIQSLNGLSINEQCDNGFHCADATTCLSDAQCAGIWDWSCALRSVQGCTTDCQTCTDVDGDDFCSDYDCNDNNPLINPSTYWFKDVDGDGYSDWASLQQCAQPTDYYLSGSLIDTYSDCDDADPTKFPTQLWYGDVDWDGYSTGIVIAQCAQPTNFYLASSLASISWDNCPVVSNVSQSDVDGDGLGDACDTPICGDGHTDLGIWEQCDDGWDINWDGCDSNCQSEICGNGLLQSGEECDDNWTTDSDGCSSTCTIEFGYECSGSPSVCTVDCGDGIVWVWEECDDGWTTNGDGCSSSCQYETPVCNLTTTDSSVFTWVPVDASYSIVGANTWWVELVSLDFDNGTVYYRPTLNSTQLTYTSTYLTSWDYTIELLLQNSLSGSDMTGICTLDIAVSAWICDLVNVPASECLALQAMYNTMWWSSWTNKTHWLTNFDVSTWYGVGITQISWVNHVTDLTLNSNNLVGIVPGQMGNLKYLNNLSLNDNTITSLDPWIWGMIELDTLFLNDNNMIGLPTTIDLLDDLNVLSVQRNSLVSLPTTIWWLAQLDALYLQNNNLASLPTSIGTLTNLDNLQLANNVLTTLPGTLWDLQDLNTLVIDNNRLTSLPSQIGNLSNLVYLSLNTNHDLLSLPDTVWWLTSLQTFYINNAWLGSLPSALGSISTLRYFYAQNNNIATLPSTIWGLWLLETLDLRGNDLVSLPNEIWSLSSLKILYLQSNALASIPSTMGSLSNLDELRVNDNLITNLPAEIGNLSNLRFLYMHNNRMTGQIPDSFTGLTNLLVFYAYNNRLARTINPQHNAKISTALTSWYAWLLVKLINWQTDVTAPVISSTTELPLLISTGFTYTLSISEESYIQNNAGQYLSVVFGGTAWCENLQTSTPVNTGAGTIDLLIYASVTGSYNACTIRVQDHGGNLSNSITMDNFIYWGTLADICGQQSITVPKLECEGLVALYESTNGDDRINSTNWLVTTDIESWFGIRTNVYWGVEHVDGIFLHKRVGTDTHGSASQRLWNGLVWTLPDEIWNFPELRDLNLSMNYLSGEIPASIWDLTKITSLYLFNNELSGPLPSSIGNLDLVTTFHVWDNKLNGELPTEIWGMASIGALDLSQNQFTWAVPTEIGNASTLWFLRLNNNYLKWNIPSSIGNLTNLTHLYLNNNGFTWTVPTSFSSLTSIWNFFIQTNNLDRDKNHNAILKTPLPTWYLWFNSKDISKQGDIIAPIISGTWTIPTISTWSFDYQITIFENSYAVANNGEWLTVAFSGWGLCSTIMAADIMTSSWIVLVDIIPQNVGVYSDCLLYVIDHGWNTSNYIQLQDFAFDNTNTSVCFNWGLNITLTECLALWSFYNAANGDNWYDNANWLQSSDVSTWFGVSLTGSVLPYHVSAIVLPNNNLSGTIIWVDSLAQLMELNLSQNSLWWGLPTSVVWLTGLRILDLSSNNFSGSLPANYSDIPNLEVLDLGDNSLVGELPSSWNSWWWLSVLSLENNSLEGEFPDWIWDLTSLAYFDVSNNSLVGTFPSNMVSATTLSTLYVSWNNLDRNFLYSATIAPSLSTFFDSITTKDLSLQWDITSPQISSNYAFTGSVWGPFIYPVAISENSFAVDVFGDPLSVQLSGSLHCWLVVVWSGIYTNSWVVELEIIPILEGTHTNCKLQVIDHAGNMWQLIMPTFVYDIGCGDGQIGPNEQCDEGRRCSDGTDCTDDSSLCPWDCEPRFVGSCNPWCRTSECGDRYIDPDGQDNVLYTQDDETCDEGKYCANWVECTLDASVCPTGELECFPRNINGCNVACVDAICGDWEIDQNGADNLPNTPDDEECDEGNNNSLTGSCTPTCKKTFCGDGIWHPNWPDGIPGNSDDEECDDGLNNGLILSSCSSTCELAGEACAWCWEYCDGGTGKHSVFLLIDVSGSMWDNNKLANAKQWAKTFIDLLPGVEYDQFGNIAKGTKVGLISYESNAKVEIAPTDNYAAVKSKIDNLQAGWSTNFSDALDDVYSYYLYNDTNLDQHVVMLSDGEPTVPTNGDGPHWRWMYSANRLKSIWVDIYTISYDQDAAWVAYMKDISSNTYRNQAYAKPVDQSSIYRTRFFFWWTEYPPEVVVDWNRDTSSYAMTNEDPYPRWEVDLGESTWIDEMWARNRWGGTSNETKNYYVHVSPNQFASDSLPTTLADPNVSSIYFPGVMAYPSEHPIDLTWRYVRIQLAEDNNPGSDNLWLSEVMLFGCKDSDVTCGTWFNYVDYNWDIIDLLYSHIYGAIQCWCTPDMICNICWDNFIQADEQCDEWSYCNDGTPCTGEPELCPTECRPRYSDTCTDTCEFPYCSDGVVNDFSSGKVCILDQGCWWTIWSCQDQIADYLVLGDACSSDADCNDVAGVPWQPNEYISYCRDDWTCALVQDYCLSDTVCTTDANCSPWYVCQDAYRATVSDPQGIKRCVLESCTSLCNSWTSISEECDDDNLLDWDGCNSSCRLEYCGDGFWDPDWWDNNPFPPFNLDNEECDDGNDIDGWSGDYCTNTCKRTSLQPGDGVCMPFTGIYNANGDGANYPWYPSLNVNDLCLVWSLGSYNYDSANHSWSWECIPSWSGSAATCLVPEYYCWDWFLWWEEECDDHGAVSTGEDGCSDVCTIGPPLLVPSIQWNSCLETRLPVVQTDEYLPMWWSLIPVASVDVDANTCAMLDPGTHIPWASMMCTFKIARAGNPAIATIQNVPCLDTSWRGTNAPLFAWVPVVSNNNEVVWNYYLHNLWTLLGWGLWQYIIVLDKVDFSFCTDNLSGGKVANPKTYVNPMGWGICDMKFAVLDWYLLQKGVWLSSVENSNMWAVEDVSGTALNIDNTVAIKDGTLQIQSQSAIDFISQWLIDEFSDAASVTTTLWWVNQSNIKKVPSMEIYFYKWTEPLVINYDLGSITQKQEPFTLVVENADLVIRWSLLGNGMYVVPNGTIEFENMDCVQPTGEEVRWIFVAGEGFVTDALRNTDLTNTSWCRWGSLIIDGLLIGNWINDNFAWNRRAVLDLWDGSINLFANDAYILGDNLYNNYYLPLLQAKVANGSIPQASVNYTIIQNAFRALDIQSITNIFAPWNWVGVYLLPWDINQMETTLHTHMQNDKLKRDKLFDGAAVLIKTNPSLWDNPPPGVKTFFEDIVISK